MPKTLQLVQVNTTGFGQTSENQMNLFNANPIDFHQPISHPTSNSRVYKIQNSGNSATTNTSATTTTIPNGNKM